MREIIQHILSDIESIKLSLDVLANQGIPIVDTFAPITTSANIITTIFATAFGGWITIILFQRQEKMKIKQELRLEFFKEYKKIYVQALKNLEDLVDTIGTVNCYPRDQYTITLDENSRMIHCGNNRELVERSIDSLTRACNSMGELSKYLELNKLLLKNYKNKLYLSESCMLIKIKFNSFQLQEVYTKIDKYNLKRNKNDKNIEILIKEYNKILLNVVDREKDLINTLNNVEIIHSEIEKEFIGQYFEEKKWYEYIINPFKKYKEHL